MTDPAPAGTIIAGTITLDVADFGQESPLPPVAAVPSVLSIVPLLIREALLPIVVRLTPSNRPSTLVPLDTVTTEPAVELAPLWLTCMPSPPTPVALPEARREM